LVPTKHEQNSWRSYANDGGSAISFRVARDVEAGDPTGDHVPALAFSRSFAGLYSITRHRVALNTAHARTAPI
jgi:hypothetical protein